MNFPGGWLGVAIAILVILAILWFLGVTFRADADAASAILAGRGWCHPLSSCG